ncbi:hypothetical protein [Pseudarthrobacter sp. DSP2-3-2b1]|uniref:hypothetical protein n=1 Tax=Pseudarthrobacter sp. DSP2-3-2b1 TaxID=2804661 RepID=UPI003CF70DFE
MGDSTTIALHLTFFGTLGLAFLMFLGLFLLVILTLVIAGVGRLAALFFMALFGRLPRNETLQLVSLSGAQAPRASGAGSGAAPDSPHDDGPAPKPAKPARAGVLPALKPRDWRKAARSARNVLKPSELRPRLQDAVEHHPLLTAARREPPVLAEDWADAVAKADARAMARARAAAPEITISVRDLPDPGVPAEKVVAVAPLVESALHQDRPARDVPRSFKKPSAPAPLSPLDTGSVLSLSGHASILKAKLPADRR